MRARVGVFALYGGVEAGIQFVELFFGQRVEQPRRDGHQPAVIEEIVLRENAQHIGDDVRVPLPRNALGVRHLVRHGGRYLVCGYVHVDVRLRIEGEIDSRDAEITHGNGQRHLLGPHRARGKIIAAERGKLRVQKAGGLFKGVRGDRVPLTVALRLCGSFVQPFHKKSRSVVHSLRVHLRLGEGERIRNGGAVVQRRVQKPEGEQHAQRRDGEAVYPSARPPELPLREQHDEPDKHAQPARDEDDRRPLVKGDREKVRHRADERGQPPRDAAREEVFGAGGKLREKKYDRRYEGEKAEPAPPCGFFTSVQRIHIDSIAQKRDKSIRSLQNFGKNLPGASLYAERLFRA